MIRHRRWTRSLLLAAAAAVVATTEVAGAAVVADPVEVSVAPGSPVAFTVFFGLDCGAVGDVHVVKTDTSPPTYTGAVELSAGPFVVAGAHATLSCTLRRDDPGGPVLASWGVSGAGTGTIPPMVPEVRQLSFSVPSRLSELYVCSRVSWVNVNGVQSEVGCEVAGDHFSVAGGPPWFDFYIVNKVQDPDLDDTVIP